MKLFFVATVALLLASCSARQICYDNGVGCFSDDPPFDNIPLPMDPVDITPTYYVLQKDKPLRLIQNCDELDVDDLVILTHGYRSSYNISSDWIPQLTNNLFTVRPTVDVLFVEWEKGSQSGRGPNTYLQPASNVRVIAKMAALWLQENEKFDSTKVHCIGYSLGAHFCGFTAKIMQTKWGRLSAIDPAALAYFMTDDPAARVHMDDAIVVDVMHGSLIGLQRPVGHKDFFVNDAMIQPGCNSAFPGCSHDRIILVYASSILEHKDCSFLYCPCPSMEHYKKGHCRSCSPTEGQLLGYRSFESPKTGIFYGATTAQEPFCIPTK